MFKFANIYIYIHIYIYNVVILNPIQDGGKLIQLIQLLSVILRIFKNN